jgi:hypothetical protein
MVFVEGDDYRALRRPGDDPVQFRSVVRPARKPSGPDSVIREYRAKNFGSSTVPDSVGSADMSTNGVTAVTLNNGGAGIKGDGVDDSGLATIPEVGNFQQSAIEFSMQTTSTNDGVPFGISNSSSPSGGSITFNTNINRDESFNKSTGQIRIQISDGSDVLRFAPSTNPNLNDGNVHKVSIIYDNAANNDTRLIIDGSQVNLTFSDVDGPSNFGDLNDDFGFFGRADDGTVSSFCDIAFGVIRFHNQSITSQTI